MLPIDPIPYQLSNRFQSSSLSGKKEFYTVLCTQSNHLINLFYILNNTMTGYMDIWMNIFEALPPPTKTNTVTEIQSQTYNVTRGDINRT